jgi:hypothetical protein
MNSGRELPCQLESRTGTALTSHWRRAGSIARPQVEFAVRNLKEQLEEGRREEAAGRKRVKFQRQELCDRKYFIIHGKTS